MTINLNIFSIVLILGIVFILIFRMFQFLFINFPVDSVEFMGHIIWRKKIK